MGSILYSILLSVIYFCFDIPLSFSLNFGLTGGINRPWYVLFPFGPCYIAVVWFGKQNGLGFTLCCVVSATERPLFSTWLLVWHSVYILAIPLIETRILLQVMIIVINKLHNYDLCFICLDVNDSCFRSGCWSDTFIYVVDVNKIDYEFTSSYDR